MAKASLSGLRFAVVGPGRVGLSLAAWLVAGGAEQTGVLSHGDAALPTDVDLLLVTVPDGAITPVATKLATAAAKPRIALHTSGARPADELRPLRTVGTRIGVLHPLRAFPTAQLAASNASDTFFALSGDPEAIELGQRIVDAWSATSAVISDRDRPLYHLAAAAAAGGAATLVATAAGVAIELGIGSDVARGYQRLAAGAVERLDPLDARTITGPVRRGELEIVERLDALEQLDPTSVPLFTLLALETLRRLESTAAWTDEHRRLRRELTARCREPGFLRAVVDRDAP